jgi:hypothetical protein
MMRLLRQIYRLPRFVRVRLIAAFALMGVIPVLAAIYVMTNRSWMMRAQLPAMSALLLICLVLACLGLHMMRETVFGIIDVSRIVQALMRLRARDKRAVSTSELVRVDRLVAYMGDQVRAAQRMMDAYQVSLRDETRPFRLPPLVPATLLRARVHEQLEQAELQRYPLGMFTWQFGEVSEREMADETLVPAWLQDVLRHSDITLDALGRMRPGHWIGWTQRVDSAQVKRVAAQMQKALPARLASRVTLTAWSHPGDAVELRWLYLDDVDQG